MKHKEHKLDGASLKVVLGKSEHSVIKEETSSCDSRIVEVTGLAAVTTEDAICNYFENTRRSGGGEVESVEMKPELNMAIVTFEEAQGSEIMSKSISKGNSTLIFMLFHLKVMRNALVPFLFC